MSKNVPLLRRAIRLVKSGDLHKARYLLAAILREEKSNELAWKWLVETYPTPREKYLVYQKWQKTLPMSREAAQGLQQYSTIYFPASQLAENNNQWLVKGMPISALILLFLTTFAFSFWFLNSNQSALALPEPTPIMTSMPITAVKGSTPDLDLADAEREIAGLEQVVAGLEQFVQVGETARQALESENSSLEAQLSESNQIIAGLASTNAGLQSEIERLNAVIAQQNLIPQISILGDNLVYHFKNKNGQLLTFDIPYQALVQTTEMTMNASRYHRYLSVRAGNMTGHVLDFRNFVKPNNFKELMADLHQENVDPFQLMVESWTIVSQVTSTSHSMSDTPQYPIDTLTSGGGNEDKAILLASMLKAADVEWQISMVYVDSKSFNLKHSPDYVMLLITYEGQRWYVDPSGTTMMPFETVDGWEFLIQ